MLKTIQWQGEELVSDKALPNGISDNIIDMTISKMIMTHLAIWKSNIPTLSLNAYA
jgi:hypothetical protein